MTKPRFKSRRQISPLEFFKHLRWIVGRPLLKVIEPYRSDLFTRALFTFENGKRKFNRVVTGRAKKNWKTTDLVLAGAYCFFTSKSTQGNDCAIIANDEGQANDDFDLLKKIIRANPVLLREVTILQKEIVRKDGGG